MQTIKLDMTKFAGAKFFKSKDGVDHIGIPLDPNNIFRGEKGLYCSLTLMDNRDGADQYGWEGFASVDVGKDRRLAGEKGPIVGNWKHLGQRPANQNGAAPPARDNSSMDGPDDADDIPFAPVQYMS